MPRTFGLPAQMCQVVTRIRMETPTDGGQVVIGDDGLPINGSGSTQPVPVRTDIGIPEPGKGCSLQPLVGTATTEINGVNYDAVIDRWRLFLPPGTDVLTNDRVQQGSDITTGVQDGETPLLDLEVDGDPMPWPGADGQPHHVEVMLKKFGGGA